MHNAQQILVDTIIIISIIILFTLLRKGTSAFGNTLGNKEFKYRFDRTRVPTAIYTAIASIVLAFAYGLIISRQIHLTLQFCIPTWFIILLGCAGMTYHRKN